MKISILIIIICLRILYSYKCPVTPNDNDLEYLKVWYSMNFKYPYIQSKSTIDTFFYTTNCLMDHRELIRIPLLDLPKKTSGISDTSEKYLYSSDYSFEYDTYVSSSQRSWYHISSHELWIKFNVKYNNDSTYDNLGFHIFKWNYIYTHEIDTPLTVGTRMFQPYPFNQIGDIYDPVYITFNAKPIEIASITWDQNQKCGDWASYSFSFVPTLLPEVGDYFRITLPFYNSYTSQSYIQYPSMVEIVNIKNFNPFSTLKISGDMITISNAINIKEYSHLNGYSFTLTNIKAPPSMKTTDNFIIDVLKSNGLEFVKAYNVKTQCYTASDISTLSVQLAPSFISERSWISVNFQAKDFLLPTSIIHFTIPDDLIIKAESITIVRGDIGMKTILDYEIKGQMIIIRNFITSDLTSNLIRSFTVGYVTNPKTTEPTMPFILTIYDVDESSLFYAYRGSPVTFTPLPGTLSHLSITPLTKIVDEIEQYKIKIINQNEIPIDGSFKIILPLTIELDLLPPEGYDDLYEECDYDTSGYKVIKKDAVCLLLNSNEIFILNAFQQKISVNTEMEFTIRNIKNPPSTKVVNFTVYSLNSNNYVIDKGVVGISFHYKDIISMNIATSSTFCSEYVSAKIVQILTDSNDANNYWEIKDMYFYIPDELKLWDEETTLWINNDISMVNQVELLGNNTYYINIPSNPKTKTIEFTFKTRNPRTTKEITAWYSDIYYIDGFLKYRNYNSANHLNPVINQHPLNEITITSYSDLTGVSTNYWVQFKTTNILYSLDIITIIIPKEIQPTLDRYLISITGLDKLSTTLTVKSNSWTDNMNIKWEINLAFQNQNDNADVDTVLKFWISGLKTPYSVQPSSAFELYIVDPKYYIWQRLGENVEPTVTVSNAHDFTSVKIDLDPLEMNTVSKLNLILNSFIPFETGDKLVILYPSEISVDNFGTSDNSNNKKCDWIVNENSISLNTKCTVFFDENTIEFEEFYFSDINSNNFDITILNIKNTLISSSMQTGTFKIYLYNAFGYLKSSRTNNMEISFSCLYPCQTCRTTNECTKCYWNSEMPYLLDGRCVSTCGSGYVIDDNTKDCVKCNEKCDTCKLSDLYQCWSCSSLYPLYIPSWFSCVNECPDGFYQDSNSNTCLKCSSPCLTCTKTATTCMTCDHTSIFPYYYNNSCLNECPNTITIKNEDRKTCVSCDMNCNTCADKVNLCTSCSTPLLLLNSQCVSRDQCLSSDNYYQDTVNNKCLQCSDGCKVCDNSPLTCKECNTGYVWDERQCYLIRDSCENGYYWTQTKWCKQCDIFRCKTCITTESTCTSCNQNTFWEGNKCVSSCSIGYFFNNDHCSKCNDKCERCIDNDSKCISCKSGLVLKGSNCVSKSECENLDGFYLNNSANMCIQCKVDNCIKCSEANQCTKCEHNLFLIDNNSCMNDCPTGYTKDSLNYLCVKNNIVFEGSNLLLMNKYRFKLPDDYFSVLSITIIIILSVTVQKISNKLMLYFACNISLLAVISRIVQWLLFIYSFQTGEILIYSLFSIIILINTILSSLYVVMYKYFTSKDEEFNYWKFSRKNVNLLYTSVMIFFDYKLIRLLYGRMNTSLFFNAKFHNFKRVHTPYKYLGYADIVFVQVFNICLCLYTVIEYKEYSFLYYLSIYQIIISICWIVNMILDYITTPDLNWDFYNQKKPKPDILPNNINDTLFGNSSRFDNSWITNDKIISDISKCKDNDDSFFEIEMPIYKNNNKNAIYDNGNIDVIKEETYSQESESCSEEKKKYSPKKHGIIVKEGNVISFGLTNSKKSWNNKAMNINRFSEEIEED